MVSFAHGILSMTETSNAKNMTIYIQLRELNEGILTRFFDWFGRKWYKFLPEWHLGKGYDKRATSPS